MYQIKVLRLNLNKIIIKCKLTLIYGGGLNFERFLLTYAYVEGVFARVDSWMV